MKKTNQKGTLNFTPILAVIIIIVLASATYNLSHKTTSFSDAIGTRQLAIIQAQSKIHKINGYIDRAADISLESAVANAASKGLGQGCGTYNNLVLYSNKNGNCFPTESETTEIISQEFNEQMTNYIQGFNDLDVYMDNYVLSLFYARDSIELIASAKYKQSMKIIAEEEKDLDFEYVVAKDPTEPSTYVPQTISSLQEPYTVWPLDNDPNNAITCFWGPRTTTSVNKQHYGIDIDDTVKKKGMKSNVLAVSDGIVTAVRQTGDSYNRFIEIDHFNDQFKSYYLHIDDVFVQVGQKVGKADVIANIDKKHNSHLHFSLIPKDNLHNQFEADQIIRSDSSSLRSYPIIKHRTQEEYYVNPICFFNKALTDKSMDGNQGKYPYICNQVGDFDEYAGCDQYAEVIKNHNEVKN
jgi:murein DD-endopeptidase MepM/ murein hydrolase activator NlpD